LFVAVEVDLAAVGQCEVFVETDAHLASGHVVKLGQGYLAVVAALPFDKIDDFFVFHVLLRPNILTAHAAARTYGLPSWQASVSCR
jgi:hypothetical protein